MATDKESLTVVAAPDLDALARLAGASISALRDEARRLGQMPFRERDEHVMRLHRALDALLATARRERRMREALVAARAHVALDDAMHDYNPFHEEGEGLDEHDPDACAACMRDAALIAIDAALAEEGQDG